MTINFILLNKMICNRYILSYHVLILAIAANPLYVLANFIATVANAISANLELAVARN